LRKTPIFCRKFAKFAENCDDNIDPRLGEFSPNVRLFTYFGQRFENYRSR
jgi:hypothetical protein